MSSRRAQPRSGRVDRRTVAHTLLDGLGQSDAEAAELAY